MRSRAKTTPRLRNRTGFSLAELMIAVALMTVMIGLAVQFFRAQTMAVSSSSGRFDAQRNAQFAASIIDRDLRVAGIGVTATQPILLQADPYAITFNADVTSHTAADVEAVYLDTDADSLATGGLTPKHKITLPLSSFVFPDSLYEKTSGVTTTAETISYWVVQDPGSAIANQYMLMRRVNDLAPQVITRGLLVPKGRPVFRYYYSPIDSLPAASLPMLHTVALHNSASDTLPAASRLVDSIRFVRVEFQAEFRDPRMAKPIVRQVSTLIRIANAGLINRTTCGDAPILGTALSAVVSGTPPIVTLSWNAATDELAGEKDVERYALYRRPDTALAFNDPPFTGIAAGAGPYTFVDNAVASGERWVYGVAAVDCTPTLSTIGAFGPVIIP